MFSKLLLQASNTEIGPAASSDTRTPLSTTTLTSSPQIGNKPGFPSMSALRPYESDSDDEEDHDEMFMAMLLKLKKAKQELESSKKRFDE